MKAVLSNYRQSPRKVRLIATMVKGKSVPEALMALNFLVKRGAEPMQKLLASAAANAKTNFGIEADKLFVREMTVNKGMVLRRIEYRARGSANIQLKRASHVEVTLDTLAPMDAKKAAKAPKVAEVKAETPKKKVPAKAKVAKK